MEDAVTLAATRLESATDPLALFDEWLRDATHSEVNDPNAMSLATVGSNGNPSVRIVLMKGRDERGFSFFSNGESRKGHELRQHAGVALCFHWKTLQRQVRIEGTVTELAAAEVDAYFVRRHRMSQVGAWASQQSRPLSSRDELLALTTEYEKKFPQTVPRPPYWTGFVVRPATIEFWQEREFRLHDRFVFSAAPDGRWTSQRLFP